MRLPELNQLLVVELRDGRRLDSRVEDIQEPDTVAIAVPTDGEQTEMLREREQVALEWTSMRGLARGEGAVTGRDVRQVTVLLVRLASSRIAQRRDYVRVETPVDVELRGKDTLPLRCKTIDLSGGGMRVHIPLPLEPGDRFDVVVALPEEPPFSAAAEVIRGDEENGYAFRFLDLEGDDHERLIRFVFARHSRQHALQRGG